MMSDALPVEWTVGADRAAADSRDFGGMWCPPDPRLGAGAGTPGTTDSPDFSTCRDPRAPEMHQCRHSDPQVGGESEDTRTIRELREELRYAKDDMREARVLLAELRTMELSGEIRSDPPEALRDWLDQMEVTLTD